ncbi:MAG: toll/interleukin-1 receptor domain-containing protein [Chloroflexota bacterium]
MVSDLILHNPLHDDLPTDPVKRIHRLARDLAWGALNNLWEARVEMRGGRFVIPRTARAGLLPEYLGRWGDTLPSAMLLSAFGYIDEQQGVSPSGAKVTFGALTQAAFALLNQPVATPQVAISYAPATSSALALLVVARLQLVGVAHPLLDMNHNPGDELHAEREKDIRHSDYMVALLAPGTLDSDYVVAELLWALESEAVNVIPVWHDGFAPPHDYPPALTARNAIRISDETTAAYHGAMVRLLNRMGYAPRG